MGVVILEELSGRTYPSRVSSRLGSVALLAAAAAAGAVQLEN